MSNIEFDEMHVDLSLNNVCMIIHSTIADILQRSSNSNKHSYILFRTLKMFVGNLQEFSAFWCNELISIVDYKYANSYFIFKDNTGIYIFVKWILEDNLYTFTISFGDYKYINHMISFED